jgi:hypothetical protein
VFLTRSRSPASISPLLIESSELRLALLSERNSELANPLNRYALVN